MKDTPIFYQTMTDLGTDPRNGQDYSPRAIEARATADDAERGRALVARLEGGDRG